MDVREQRGPDLIIEPVVKEEKEKRVRDPALTVGSTGPKGNGGLLEG